MEMVTKRVAVFIFLVIVFSCGEKTDPTPAPPESHTFTNPVLSSSPDPWVFQRGGKYFVTYTTGNNIRLYAAEEMSDIALGQTKVIWTPPASGMNSKNIWAPEIHYVTGRWYVYYAADDGNNQNHRIWVLENSSEDPFQGEWIDRGQLQLPDDKWAIDGTITTINGVLYFAWSGWESDQNVRQDIYLVKMQTPLTAIGTRIKISSPQLPWELAGGSPAVNEAPQFLIHDNSVFITYSASGCWTDDYAIGLLSASGGNLLEPSSWAKSDQPLLTKNAASLAYGPGHNAFFKSKDGTEDWITYHANASAGAGCGDSRSMRMQKFTWQNGKPFFGQPVAIGSAIQVPSGEN